MPETATESGPYTPAPWSPDFAKTAESIYEPQIAEARGKAAEASGQEQRILKERGGAMAPAIGQLEQGLTEPRPAAPQRAMLPPPPSRQLHDFLAPVENQPPAQTVMQMISALTMLGTGIGGLAKGDARAALSALTGALTGWKEGQRERADRAFADWQANTDALLKNSKMEWEEYYAALEDRKASNAEKLQNVQAIAMKFDNPLMAAAAAKGDANTLIGQLMQDRKHIDDVDLKRQGLGQSWELRQQQLAIDRARLIETIERDRQMAIDRKERMRIDEELRRGNLDMRHLMTTYMLEKPLSGKRYYDKDTGEVRELSLSDWVKDKGQRQESGKSQYTMLNNQQVQLLERLAVAPPILDRLDTLVDRINAAAPGENITQGLINRLRRKAGIGDEIQQFTTLRLDSALENAAALSGGTPRISILYMLRGEASPSEFMTRDTAHATIDTTRRTIQNRMQTTTGDPDAMKKMSQGLSGYELPREQPSSGWGKATVVP